MHDTHPLGAEPGILDALALAAPGECDPDDAAPSDDLDDALLIEAGFTLGTDR